MTTQTTLQKNFDYTAIANRLRTVSWSNYGHPTGVVYRFYRAKANLDLHPHRLINGKTIEVYTFLYQNTYSGIPNKVHVQVQTIGVDSVNVIRYR